MSVSPGPPSDSYFNELGVPVAWQRVLLGETEPVASRGVEHAVEAGHHEGLAEPKSITSHAATGTPYPVRS